MPHHDEVLANLLGRVGPQSLAVGASPFTYPVSDTGAVVISGGTVSLVEIGRAGSFVVGGVLAGMFPVWRGDQVRVTYVVAPTMTLMRG